MNNSYESIFLAGPLSANVKADWKLYREYETKLRTGNPPFNIMNPIRVIIQNRKVQPKADKPNNPMIGDDSWQRYCNLRYCLGSLAYCHGVYLMPGWTSCPSALIIVSTAHDLGLKIYTHVGDKLILMKGFSIVAEAMGGSSVEEIRKDENSNEVSKQPAAKESVSDDDFGDDEQTSSQDDDEAAKGMSQLLDEDLGRWFERNYSRRP